MKAESKENECGNGKQGGLQQKPSTRKACKAGDDIIQSVMKVSTNYSPSIHALATQHGGSSIMKAVYLSLPPLDLGGLSDLLWLMKY